MHQKLQSLHCWGGALPHSTICNVLQFFTTAFNNKIKLLGDKFINVGSEDINIYGVNHNYIKLHSIWGIYEIINEFYTVFCKSWLLMGDPRPGPGQALGESGPGPRLERESLAMMKIWSMFKDRTEEMKHWYELCWEENSSTPAFWVGIRSCSFFFEGWVDFPGNHSGVWEYRSIEG